MKNKKNIIYIILGVIVLVASLIGIYKIITNENKLTSEERTWINENVNNVQNISVVKNANGFSNNGTGVFYEFLSDLSEEYDIQINVVSEEEGATTTNNYFTYTLELTDNSRVLYTDHYVVVSTSKNSLKSMSDLEGSVVGVLSEDSSYIQSYLKDLTISFNGYDTIDELLESVTTSVDYIIIPRLKYIDSILTNDLEIVYHLSDINIYYTFESNGDILSSIINKYLNKWEDNIEVVLKEEEFSLFTVFLNITSSEVDTLRSVDYNYGFVNNSPYEVIMNGTYGGIIAEYLQEFSEFAGVYFDITKYSSETKLINAISKDKVDIYFDYDHSDTEYTETTYGITSTISIVTRKDNTDNYNSIYGLQGSTVYVKEDSTIYDYLSSIGGINIETYATNKELYKLNKENAIIVIDSYIFEYLNDNKLDNYVSKYSSNIDYTYNFKIDSDYEVLYTLFNKYLSYLDSSSIIGSGLNSHESTVSHGEVLNRIAIYTIVFIIIVLLGGFIYYKRSKKIKLRRRLKKDDKIRFIDELTCLKNRAYLSDFIKTWNNNTVYPQTIIVVDLNRLKEINDHFGVTEGDKQIQAAANALIKTQLDNSELMRSDGNEFVIYLVGYTQKQVVNYIHKLNKEFKHLPYNYGAEFGYSIIESNLKTVEDALTEAIADMKAKKESKNDEKKD